MNLRTPDQLLLPWSPQHTISAKRVAALLDCCVGVVYAMIEDGTLKGYKVREDKIVDGKVKKTNSPWRVYRDSFESYIERMHTTNGLEQRF